MYGADLREVQVRDAERRERTVEEYRGSTVVLPRWVVSCVRARERAWVRLQKGSSSGTEAKTDWRRDEPEHAGRQARRQAESQPGYTTIHAHVCMLQSIAE